MRLRALSLALAAAVALGALTPAMAQDRRYRDYGWRDRDIHRFHDHDFARWQHGRWYRGRHDGRQGWWWIVGGTWYYYPRATYPYPDPYTPPYAAPAAPAWYYCPPVQTYYPYVASCPVPWQVMPAR
jgi:hypothetical protein